MDDHGGFEYSEEISKDTHGEHVGEEYELERCLLHYALDHKLYSGLVSMDTAYSLCSGLLIITSHVYALVHQVKPHKHYSQQCVIPLLDYCHLLIHHVSLVF